MTYQNYSTEQLQQLDNKYYLHPDTDHKELRGEGARIITRGEGPFIYDSEGNEILDGLAGLWCVNLGYGREELARAAYEQMKELPYYNSFFKCTTPSPILLAARVAELAPSHMNEVFFGSSGSESNDTAIRMVRYYWELEGKPEKQIIISREDAYHGSTIAAVSMGGMNAMQAQGGALLEGFSHVMAPYSFENANPGESDEAFGLRAAAAIETEILRLGADKVAAFVGEPIQGAGGVKIPPANYWAEVQRICQKYDILLMLDEVITGFGRTGAWFAAESMDIKPDTITVAKAITSGYQPLSAVIVGDRIASTLVEKGGEFYHGYTYSGHPVACAVALKNLEIIEKEGLVERVRDDTGPYFAEALAKAVGNHPIVGEVRSLGLVGAIEIVKDRASKERFASEKNATLTIREISTRNGLIMRAVGDAMILSPPLIWTRETIDLAVSRIVASLDEAAGVLLD